MWDVEKITDQSERIRNTIQSNCNLEWIAYKSSNIISNFMWNKKKFLLKCRRDTRHNCFSMQNHNKAWKIKEEIQWNVIVFQTAIKIALFRKLRGELWSSSGKNTWLFLKLSQLFQCVYWKWFSYKNSDMMSKLEKNPEKNGICKV